MDDQSVKQDSEEVKSATSNSTENAENVTGDSEKPKKKESLINKIKAKRKEKADAKKSYALDLACIVFIIIFAAWFKPKNYVGQHTPLLYYYEDAVVTSNERVEYEDGTRWCVTIEYAVGDDTYSRNLYYKRNPKYKPGDLLKLKIQTINPDNIEIEGKQ